MTDEEKVARAVCEKFYGVFDVEDLWPAWLGEATAALAALDLPTRDARIRREAREAMREEAAKDEEEAYQLGKRDGYESAVQDIDMLTGGDGEYFGSTMPGRGSDVHTMKAGIADRFAAIRALATEGDRA